MKAYSPVPEGAETLLIKELNVFPSLYIAANDRDMSRIAEGIRFFAPEIEVVELPAWDTLPYDRTSPNPVIVSKRIAALSKLSQSISAKTVVVTTANAVLQRTPTPQIFKNSSLLIEKAKEANRDQIINFLNSNGYDRVSKVIEPGEYAVRGSIIDIFPSGADEGIRIDFFGDEVESIKTFDPLSQVSETTLPRFQLLPASEIIYSADTIERFKRNYRNSLGAVTKTTDELYEAISAGAKYPGMENWLPLFYDEVSNIFDFLPEHTQIIKGPLVSETLEERFEIIKDYYEARKANSPDYKALLPKTLYLTDDEIGAQFNKDTSVEFQNFNQEGATETAFKGIMSSDYRISNPEWYKKLEAEKTYIACFSQGSLQHLSLVLTNHKISNTQIAKWAERGDSNTNAVLFVLPIEKGFRAKGFKLISEQDIFGDRFIRTVKKKKKAENFLSEAAGLNINEIIVHEEHGIGRFIGLETITVNNIAHDMLKIMYDGEAKLFVPVENIDVISRYGAEDENVRLDKLGGVAWQERKSRLKDRIRIAADELLKIAAERELKTAPRVLPNEGMYAEFTARFPYNETEDQLSSIEEVLSDLARGKPMDRLICGDVGFGKTEVAIRAAFAAASQGLQVAIIGPTTLLSRQHFATFSKRFDDMAINVKQLSRMVTAADMKKTKEGLANGSVDIVIGTHALLADDMKFKNLGLVIIDEEQHFGVAQKEKLKKLRAEIHILSLSATPIPRSLQLAMSGVRDLSIIATPPVDRLAIRTFVMPFDELIIREAILRERNRGGVVFYVAPRVADLEELSITLKKLIPEAKFAVAHGKMTPNELDRVMNDFFDAKFDVLISTAIVESGLDITNANTIIIHRADMFGLSQLYQLRGRVGRGKTRGYAYFTLPKQRILTDNAYKRLEVIQGLDGLGAGFSIASHDMDIRGFGNLLGHEQHGHVREVGVELYQKMLQEAVLRARAEGEISNKTESYTPNINLGMSVLIPDYYIAELDLRLSMYRRAAALETDQDISAFMVELTDRFGRPPMEVLHLMEVIRLKNLCRQAGVSKIDAGPKAVVMQFIDNPPIGPEKLMKFALKNPDRVKIRPDNKLVFDVDKKVLTDELVTIVKDDLMEIIKLADTKTAQAA